MNHGHHLPSSENPPDAQGSAEADAAGSHGGWGMAGMMLLCCIPMVVLIALAVVGSR